MPTGYCNVPGSRVRRPVIVPIGPSIAYVPLTKGLFALIDREDAERVTLHSWVAMKPRYNWYAAARINYKYVPLHRFLLDPPEGMVVDHRDTQRTLDNRRNCGQIRLATPSQNNFNRTLRRVTKSGLRGVWLYSSGKWKAEITVNRKKISLGYFWSKEDAHAAYCRASAMYHGEFSKTDPPLSQATMPTQAA